MIEARIKRVQILANLASQKKKDRCQSILFAFSNDLKALEYNEELFSSLVDGILNKAERLLDDNQVSDNQAFQELNALIRAFKESADLFLKYHQNNEFIQEKINANAMLAAQFKALASAQEQLERDAEKKDFELELSFLLECNVKLRQFLKAAGIQELPEESDNTKTKKEGIWLNMMDSFLDLLKGAAENNLEGNFNSTLQGFVGTLITGAFSFLGEAIKSFFTDQPDIAKKVDEFTECGSKVANNLFAQYNIDNEISKHQEELKGMQEAYKLFKQKKKHEAAEQADINEEEFIPNFACKAN